MRLTHDLTGSAFSYTTTLCLNKESNISECGKELDGEQEWIILNAACSEVVVVFVTGFERGKEDLLPLPLKEDSHSISKSKVRGTV